LDPGDGGQPATGPTWTTGIATIFHENCVRCHGSGQFSTYAPLQTYEQVLLRLENIRQKVQLFPSWGTQMPPFPGGERPGVCEPQHAYSNDLRMSEQNIADILTWIANGTLRGTGADPGEPLVAPGPATISGATEYPFTEGYVMEIADTDEDGHKDDYACIIVDPGTVAGNRYYSGIQINPSQPQVFRGAVVWLDRNRESLQYVQSGSPRTHGAQWYDCTDGFGFTGDILSGYLPKGQPVSTPAGSAVAIPGNALIVYKIHYHAHYDHVDPEDMEPLPQTLQWPDTTSLSVKWESAPARTALALTFGNYDAATANGTGNLNAPFLIPAGAASHVESMVTTVPGPSTATYAVWAVQPEMNLAGQTVSVSMGNQTTQTQACLGVVPRWEKSWQMPLTYDTAVGAPTVRGGDRLRIDCEYRGRANGPMTLAEESCRAMVGLVPTN